MMHKRLFPLLMLCCLLLSGCRQELPLPEESIINTADIPAPAVEDIPQSQDQATLWFRLNGEPYLASESREIAHSRTESHALVLLQALLEGPAVASTDLAGLFPPGTRVISTTQEDNVMFVTLSRHIMNSYADEPSNWRELPYWAIEVPLRRQLAMQAIAATLTENCAVDTIVILVEQTGNAADSLRLRQSYFTLDGSTALAPALQRDEALLLTPARTAEVILQYWQTSNWQRLYRYIARTDPDTGLSRPDETDFIQLMATQKHLIHAAASGGSIRADGQRAVFTLNGAWMTDGATQPFSGRVLRLTREKGLWRVGLSQLTGREALP